MRGCILLFLLLLCSSIITANPYSFNLYDDKTISGNGTTNITNNYYSINQTNNITTIYNITNDIITIYNITNNISNNIYLMNYSNIFLTNQSNYVNGSIYPLETLMYDLGSGAYRWNWLYVRNISVEDINAYNLYASQSTKHRGDWVDIGSQAGQYRFDQMGQDRSGFSSYGKYGGYMQDGGEQAYLSGDDFPSEDPQYNEGDEVYMTEDDLKNFMANGGQIEYL
jgi:hypothetical protein